MTTEERFQKIENVLQHAAEIQAQHAEGIARLQRMQEGLIVVLNKMSMDRRASEEDFDRRLNQLRDIQQETERKLQRFLDGQKNGHT